jgi:hypothetical protein
VMIIHLRSLAKSRLKQKLGSINPSHIKLVKQTINDLLNY